MAKDITLACGHERALAQLSRDGKTAWCYVCEAVVDVNPSVPASQTGEKP